MDIIFHNRVVFPTDNDNMLYSYPATESAIKTKQPIINTTQMGLLSAELWEAGYRIFVIDKDGKYEIKVGGENKRTQREIKTTHNLFKMWQNGEFDLA